MSNNAKLQPRVSLTRFSISPIPTTFSKKQCCSLDHFIFFKRCCVVRLPSKRWLLPLLEPSVKAEPINCDFAEKNENSFFVILWAVSIDSHFEKALGEMLEKVYRYTLFEKVVGRESRHKLQSTVDLCFSKKTLQNRKAFMDQKIKMNKILITKVTKNAKILKILKFWKLLKLLKFQKY